MKFLLATTLTCVVLVVETTEIGKGLSRDYSNSLAEFERDIALLKKQNMKLQSDLQKQNVNLQSDLKKQNESLQSDLKEHIEKFESDLKEQNESLQFDLAEYNEKLQSDMKEQNEKLQTDLRELKDTLTAKNRKVVFEAQLSSDTYFGPYEALKFNRVPVNTGYAYRSYSGHFNAPVDGTYLFWANVVHTGSGYFALYLMTTDHELTKGFTGDSVTSGTATINHVVKLKRGDHVWLSISPGTQNIRGDNYSSFGGVLLFA